MKFLTEKQVAEIIGLSIKTLQRWRLFGKGPEWRKFGSSVRYPADTLAGWIESAPRGGRSQVQITKNELRRSSGISRADSGVHGQQKSPSTAMHENPISLRRDADSRQNHGLVPTPK